MKKVGFILVMTGTITSTLVTEAPMAAQAAPTINEDIVPCSFAAGDPYVMTIDICRAWGRLQDAAIARVNAVGGLAVDRSLTLTRARSQVQTMLWTIVNEAAVRPDGERSRDERLVLGWLAGLSRQHAIDVAQRALQMYDDFYRDQRPGPGSPPCTFTPPAPYESEYPGKDAVREAFCFPGSAPDVFGIGVTNKPKTEEWLRWASADVFKVKYSPAALDIARNMSQNITKVAVIAAAAVAAGVVSGVVASNLVGAAAAAIAAGFTITATIVSIAFIAFAVVVAVAAVILAIYGTIVMFTDGRQGLESALRDAQKPVDPSSLLSTEAGRELTFTLFTGWLGTQPQPVAAAPAPQRVGSDPRFTVTPVGGTTSAVVDEFTIRAGDGTVRTATMRGGYWVITEATGTAVTLDLPGLDRDGKAGTISRVSLGDGRFGFVTFGPDVVCAGTTDCEARREFTVTGGDGRRTVVRYVGTQDGQDQPVLTFDFDKVSTASIGVPASFFAAAFDTSGARVAATYTWEIGSRCLTRYSSGCSVLPPGTAVAPDGSPIATAGVGAGISYTFPTSGTWWMRVRATTASGQSTSNWFTVEVGNPAPTLALTSPATGQVVCSTAGNTTCPPLVLGPFGLGVTGLVTDVASQYELTSIEIDWGDGNREWDDSGPDLIFCPRPGAGGSTTYVPCVEFGGLSGENRPFSASYFPNPDLYGNRTVKVTVRDSNGSQASLTAPYVVPDPRALQTVTIDPAPPTSWADSIPLTATASSGLPVTFTAEPSQWCVVDAVRLYSARVGTCTVTANQAGDATRQPATASRDFTFTARSATISFPQPADAELPADGVTPLALTVGAADATGAAPAGTVQMTSSTPTVCTVSGTQVLLLRTGSCTLTAAVGATVTNWTAAPVERTFTVLRTTQQISLQTPVLVGVVAGSSPVQASASSGLPVTVTATPSTVCSIAPSGSQWIATYVGGGDCVVTARQGGDERWAPATVTNTITVTRSFQSSFLVDQPASVQAGGSFTVRVGGTFGTPFVVAAGPAAVCGLNLAASTVNPSGISTYRIDTVTSGNCLLTVDRPGSAVYDAAEQVSATVAVVAKPGAPTGVTAVLARSGTAAVSFVPPSNNGNSSITSYRAVCSSTGTGVARSASGTATTLNVSGLTTGATYQCRVNATNVVGTGPGSAASASFVAVVPPSAPTGVAAVRNGSGSLSVSFTPPTSTGGSPITGYKAVCSSSDGGVTRWATGTASPVSVGGLTGGATYTCVVYAQNSVGSSPASIPTTSVGVLGVPGSPTVRTAVRTTPTRATVSFTPPASNGGSTITSYRVVCTSATGGPSSASGTGSPLVVVSLTPGADYTCRASATNAIGTSTASAPVAVTAPAV